MANVLLIRWAAMGDIVMALPCAAAIKAQSPNDSLAWSVDTRFAELVTYQEDIDRVFSFDRRAVRGKGWNPLYWRRILRSYLAPRAFRADLAIDLQGHAKTTLALMFSGAKRKVTFAPKDLVARTLGGKSFLPERKHQSLQFLDCLASAGYRSDGVVFRLPISEANAKTAVELFPSDPFVTFHLGSTHIKKQWQVEKFATVGRRLAETGKLVVVVGGAGEQALVDQFAQYCPCVDLVGLTSILVLAAGLQMSDLHVSGDTGTAHLAAAGGTPCVTVFGHMDPEVYHPYGQRAGVVESGGNINQVEADAVIARSLQVLSQRT